jgi:hypothetical protein
MRRSERDAVVASSFGAVLGKARGAAAQARAGLVVGSGLAAPEGTTAVPDLAQASLLGRRFSSVLWVLTSDLSALGTGLARVRGALLLPGGTLLLVAPKRAPALHQLRALLAGDSAPRASLTQLCNGLLLGGFLSPRVHDGLPGWLLVSAALAATPDPLDAFFQQPGAVDGR